MLAYPDISVHSVLCQCFSQAHAHMHPLTIWGQLTDGAKSGYCLWALPSSTRYRWLHLLALVFCWKAKDEDWSYLHLFAVCISGEKWKRHNINSYESTEINITKFIFYIIHNHHTPETSHNQNYWWGKNSVKLGCGGEDMYYKWSVASNKPPRKAAAPQNWIRKYWSHLLFFFEFFCFFVVFLWIFLFI